MLNLNHFGYKVVMHVHDEVILEVPEGERSLEQVLRIMSHSSKWEPNLKLNSEGYETPYYKKD